MIIDQPSLVCRFGRAVLIIAGLHTVILAAYIIITLVPGNSQSVTVIMPSNGLRNALASNVSVISWSTYTAQLASNDPNFVRGLYKAGALFVLPTLDAFCISLE